MTSLKPYYDSLNRTANAKRLVEEYYQHFLSQGMTHRRWSNWYIPQQDGRDFDGRYVRVGSIFIYATSTLNGWAGNAYLPTGERVALRAWTLKGMTDEALEMDAKGGAR